MSETNLSDQKWSSLSMEEKEMSEKKLEIATWVTDVENDAVWFCLD